MTFPEWTKPGIYGAVVGAIAISILGFSWGGWTTSSTAQEMAQSHADKAVTTALVPVCLQASADDPDRIAKVAVIKAASGFRQRNEMLETGWATPPGADSPSRDLADACLEGLNLDG